jgi:hypothetical protein
MHPYFTEAFARDHQARVVEAAELRRRLATRRSRRWRIHRAAADDATDRGRP